MRLRAGSWLGRVLPRIFRRARRSRRAGMGAAGSPAWREENRTRAIRAEDGAAHAGNRPSGAGIHVSRARN